MDKPNITEGEWKPFLPPIDNDAMVLVDETIVADNMNIDDAKATSAVPDMIKALIESYKAIKSVPDEALGIGSMTNATGTEQQYLIKHELRQDIENALRKAGVEL